MQQSCYINGWDSGKIEEIPTTLNTLCNALYGKGNKASSARSINANDINKLADYNPQSYNVLYQLEEVSTFDDYNYIVYYYSLDNGNTWKFLNSASSEDDYGVVDTKEPTTITEYSYNLEDRIKITTSDNSKMSDILSGTYWVATYGTSLGDVVGDWDFRRSFDAIAKISNKKLSFSTLNMKDTITAPGPELGYIRPVVTFSSDVEFGGEYNETTGWEIK